MKKGTIIGLSILGIVLLLIVGSIASVLSSRTTMIKLENQIDAQYVANQTSYDAMWKTFKEMAQVTEQQAEHYKELYTGLIGGRYEDSAPLFQMIKEDNPQLGTEVYTNLQAAIESGRANFNNMQMKITDVVREYNTYVEVHFIMSAILGKTELDMNDFVITSDETKKTFDDGGSDEVDLFDNKDD